MSSSDGLVLRSLSSELRLLPPRLLLDIISFCSIRTRFYVTPGPIIRDRRHRPLSPSAHLRRLYGYFSVDILRTPFVLFQKITVNLLLDPSEMPRLEPIMRSLLPQKNSTVATLVLNSLTKNVSLPGLPSIATVRKLVLCCEGVARSLLKSLFVREEDTSSCDPDAPIRIAPSLRSLTLYSFGGQIWEENIVENENVAPAPPEEEFIGEIEAERRRRRAEVAEMLVPEAVEEEEGEDESEQPKEEEETDPSQIRPDPDRDNIIRRMHRQLDALTFQSPCTDAHTILRRLPSTSFMHDAPKWSKPLRLKSLSLRNFWVPSVARIDMYPEDNLLPCANLVSLEVVRAPELSDAEVRVLVRYLGHLERLVLRECEGLTVNTCYSVLCLSRSVRILELAYLKLDQKQQEQVEDEEEVEGEKELLSPLVGGSKLEGFCPLECLSLEGSRLTQVLFEEFVAASPQLESLNVRRVTGYDDPGFLLRTTTPTTPKSLRHLTIDFDSPLAAALVAASAKSPTLIIDSLTVHGGCLCPDGIQFLEIFVEEEDKNGISDAFLESLAGKSELRVLMFEECEGFSEEQVALLKEKCPMLQRLVVKGEVVWDRRFVLAEEEEETEGEARKKFPSVVHSFFTRNVSD